jgi:hypothetical protein
MECVLVAQSTDRRTTRTYHSPRVMHDSAPKDHGQARECPLGYDEETVTCSWWSVECSFFNVGYFCFCGIVFRSMSRVFDAATKYQRTFSIGSRSGFARYLPSAYCKVSS